MTISTGQLQSNGSIRNAFTGNSWHRC